MSVVEYLKKLRLIGMLQPLFVMMGMLGGCFVGAWGYRWLTHVPFSKYSPMGFACWMVTALVFGCLALYMTDRREQGFLRKHPEMEHISDWGSVVGNIANYPVRGIDNPATAFEATDTLVKFAHRASASFAARDQIVQLLAAAENNFDAGSPYLSYLRAIKERLEQEARDQNEKYKRAWLLLFQKMNVVPISGSMDYTEYRESLLKRK